MDQKLIDLVKKIATSFLYDVTDYESETCEKKFKNWFENFGEDYIKGFNVKNKARNIDVEFIDISAVEKQKQQYDKDGNAKHYNTNRINHLVKSERIYGTIGCMLFCEINAEKYRDRIGEKKGQNIEIELMKINWNKKASLFYFERLGTKDEIIINNRNKYNLPWLKK